MVRPWSIGINLYVIFSVVGSVSLYTRMFPSLRSRLKIRRSRTAILWTSSAEKRLEEKSSIGPMLGTNVYREPTLGGRAVQSEDLVDSCLVEQGELEALPVLCKFDF